MPHYFILDLERSIATGRMFFWKGNKHGYTTELDQAGLFPEDKAEAIAAADFDRRTVLIPAAAALKIYQESR